MIVFEIQFRLSYLNCNFFSGLNLFQHSLGWITRLTSTIKDNKTNIIFTLHLHTAAEQLPSP